MAKDDLGADEHHHDFDHTCGDGYLYISIIAFIYYDYNHTCDYDEYNSEYA